MAGRSQLPVQIMENQTRFDLNAAIENWRNELAAQPNLASDDRRELETHLRDLISEFRREGIGDEESFRLASEKIGQLRQVGKEFRKNKIFTINKRAMGFGAVYGLMTGLVMFLIGLCLTSQPHPILIPSFILLNAPAMGLISRLHDASYNWFSNAGLSQLFAAFLIYWTMLGALIGLGSNISMQNQKTPKHN
jgi:hypothetical protein